MSTPGYGERLRPFMLLLLLLLAGCHSYYRVNVSGDKPDDVRSVFLIVATENPLAGDNNDATMLIRAEKVSDYLLFAQFEPTGGAPLRWRAQRPHRRGDLIEVKLSEDQRRILLSVDKELLEAYGNLSVVAVCHGASRWYAEVFDSGRIRTEDGIRLEAGVSSFVIGPIKSANLLP